MEGIPVEPPITASAVAALLKTAELEELPALIERYGEDPRKQVASAVKSARKRLERDAQERERVAKLYLTMRELGGDGVIIGVDEVGRGAVAGPLTVAAVVLPDEPHILGLDDSKKLTPKKREEVAAEVAKHALAIGICHIEAHAIDAAGMSASLRVAVRRAIADAGVEPDCVLLDGNPMGAHPKEKTIVKGDAKVACIAAASIVAKVTRDALMVSLDAEYPGYHLAHSKGYASPEHIKAIQEKGLSHIHRATFCTGFFQEQLPF